jgi:uncharacterized membrane protein YsdA (DUF1294 family)
MQKQRGRMRPKKQSHKNSTYPFFIAALTFLTVGIFGGFWTLTTLGAILSYIIAVNLTSFILCGYDKGIAGSSSTRVPEAVFFGSALIGGSAGLLFGMNLFRHKTQKASFQFVLALILALQIVCWRFVQHL